VRRRALHTNFQNLATSSAVLIGFGFSALSISSTYHPEGSTKHDSIWELPAHAWRSPYFLTEVLFQAVFAMAASLALGFNLISLFVATISSMCGPGMALRGPEGSVHTAVRHMEQQLKRSLRFFGRGVVAFVLTLTTVGLRSLQDVGFLGSVITIGIGGWTFYALWYYGSDIAEKFYISPNRAVRGTFVKSKASGEMLWQNTADELASQGGGSIRRSVLPCLRRQRWRPDGHTAATPLWRLDKMLAFPYHTTDDRGRLRSSSVGSQAANREQAQMQTLVMNAQGNLEPSYSRDSAGEVEDPQSIGYFDPLKALQLVGNVLAGVSGEEERAAPSRGAGGGSGGSGADAAGVVRGGMAHTIAQSRGNERLLPHNMGRS